MKAPEIVHRTVGPWWVGGRGLVYEETYILKDGRVMTRKQYEALYHQIPETNYNTNRAES